MQPAPPAALQLASRLKHLRQHQSRLTQAQLAAAFSKVGNLASVTISSWESLKSPKLPPVDRLRAYARFFATPRSVEGQPKLLPFNELTQDEKKECEKLADELLRLRIAASGESPQRFAPSCGKRTGPTRISRVQPALPARYRARAHSPLPESTTGSPE